jgi:hypothetical protein
MGHAARRPQGREAAAPPPGGRRLLAGESCVRAARRSCRQKGREQGVRTSLNESGGARWQGRVLGEAV